MQSSVQKALKADRILPRPYASTGIWVSFLLPLAVILGSFKTPKVSELYLSCGVYSFNILLNVLHLFFHILKYKSINVTKGVNILCAIPAAITIYLYIQFLDLDFRRSLCYTVANALIYFEGIPFIFKVFPRSFTFGEANIIIQGLSLFIYSLFLRLNSILVEGPPKSEYDICTVILQLALSWVLIFCIGPYTYSGLRKVVPLYLWGFTVLGIIYFCVYWVLNCHLFLWVWDFVTKIERIGLMTLWLLCFTAAVIILHNQIQRRTVGNTIVRKDFHILAVFVFMTGALLDVNLIYFSSGCTLGLFIVLEVFRVLELPPLYDFLQDGFIAYCDEKDAGILAMTPIYLLAGISLPFWLHPSTEYPNDKQLVLISGVLSVGIGDTFASVGGSVFGKHKWKGSEKSIEGTIFCIVSQLICLQLIISFGVLQVSSEYPIKGVIAVLITSFAEAKTDQIDNIVLPLIMYIVMI